MERTAVALLGGLSAVAFLMAGAARRGRERNPEPSRALSRLLAGVGAWMGLDLVTHLVAVGLPWLALLSGATYAAIGVVISSFLVLCVSMAGTGWVPSRRARVLLAAHPTVVGLLALTYPWHHLFTWLVPGASSTEVSGWAFGPLFWVHIGWCYLAVVFGTVVVAFGAWQLPRGFRRQGLLVACAPVGAMVMNLVALLGIATPVDGLPIDQTAVGLALGAPFLAYAVLRSDLVVMPSVARSLVVRRLPEALVALSREGRVLDLNPPGRALLGSLGHADRMVGSMAPVRLLEVVEQARGSAVDLRLEGPEGITDHLLRVHPLLDEAGREIGRVVVARDVTSERRAEDELHERMRVIEELRGQLAHEADHDPLTGLFNRRRLDQALIALDERREAYSLVIADIDRFKAVNDRHGHAAGDAVLRQVAQVLLRFAAPDVVVGRWGGEEFVLVVSCANPRQLAEAVRAAAVQSPATVHGATIPWTVSIGVAVGAPGVDPDHLLAAADDALYAAKRRGRNRVEVSYRLADHAVDEPAADEPAADEPVGAVPGLR